MMNHTALRMFIDRLLDTWRAAQIEDDLYGALIEYSPYSIADTGYGDPHRDARREWLRKDMEGWEPL